MVAQARECLVWMKSKSHSGFASDTIQYTKKWTVATSSLKIMVSRLQTLLEDDIVYDDLPYATAMIWDLEPPWPP